MAVVLLAARTSRCESGAIVVARRGKNASACSSSARPRRVLGAPARDCRHSQLASPTRGTAWGLGGGHAHGWGGQDSTADPKGSLEAVPRVSDASRDDVIGTLRRCTGESP
jgi:hypothetical protein